MRIFQIFRKRSGCGHPKAARQHYRKGNDCSMCAAAFEQIITASYPERGRGRAVGDVPVVEP